jgi:UDP-N-acetylmuramoylalanine--D-glutamate ligase
VQTAHVHGSSFWYGDTKLCSLDALKLPGAHNLDNACAAIDAAWRWVQDGKNIERGLESFTGLPHRLKFVRELKKVQYFDDSIATTPGSAIAAMRAFAQPVIIILGGSSKGADFSDVAKVAADSGVKKAILIGQEAAKIEYSLKEQGVPYSNMGSDVSMVEVVAAAQQAAEPGDVVVLSPACASFGMFKNYSDRGDQYIAAVQAL